MKPAGSIVFVLLVFVLSSVAVADAARVGETSRQRPREEVLVTDVDEEEEENVNERELTYYDDYYDSTPSIDLDITACFSEATTVRVNGNPEPVLIKDLVVGDFVMVDHQGPVYDRVYAWGHREVDATAVFYQFYVEDDDDVSSKQQPALEITGNHLVYLQTKSNPIRADSVKEGDILRTTTSRGGSNNNNNVVVTKIRTIQRKGLYAPLTRTGRLLVNVKHYGIHASAYIAMQRSSSSSSEWIQWKGMDLPISHHDFAHLVSSPFRVVCSASNSMMGSSSGLCQPTTDNDHHQGMPYYVATGIDLFHWVDDDAQPFWIQAIIAVVGLVGFGTVLFLENILDGGSTVLAPLSILVLSGAIYSAMKVYGISVRQTSKTI